MSPERHPSGIVKRVLVDSFENAAVKTATVFASKVMIPVTERIAARFDPEFRQRSVEEVIKARYEGREPMHDAVEHVKCMPGSVVKKILIDE